MLESATAGLSEVSWLKEDPYPRLIDLRGQRFNNRDTSRFTSPWSIDGRYGYAILGANHGETLGIALASGDFNGDGIDDLVIRSFDEFPGNPEDTLTYVVYGTTEYRDDAIVTDLSDSENGFLFQVGEPIWDTGDFDGDGVGDLVLSLPGDDFMDARAEIFFGATDLSNRLLDSAPRFESSFRVFNQFASRSRFPVAVNAGDVNGDGIDDIHLPLENTELNVDEVAFIYGDTDRNAILDTSLLDGSDGTRLFIPFQRGTANGGSTPIRHSSST